MNQKDRIKKADEIKEKLGISNSREEKFSQDHPFVESYKILEQIMEFLSDVDNEAFTQLDKGSYLSRDPFVDETKTFAEAIRFAERPFANLEKRLADAGIFREVKKIEKVIIDGEEQELETVEQIPVRIEVRPLKGAATEWMRKRHSVNRLRVNEFIRLAQAARGGEFLMRTSTMVGQEQSISGQGRRLI